MTEHEQAQLRRLAASLGPFVAARTVGVDRETFAAAMNGAALNPTTAAKLRQSSWLV